MTQDERISAYIDNELSAEQEQEFLISLAASNGLRKSFRSELVLKNVLHRDGAVTNPPGNMRSAVFAALGLGMATGVSTKADAAQKANSASQSLLKTFFATKISTLVTAAGISVSALAGYGVHSVLTAGNPSQVENVRTPPTQRHAAPVYQSAPTEASNQTVSEAQPSVAKPNLHQGTSDRIAAGSQRTASKVNGRVITPANSSEGGAVNGAAGSGVIDMQTPVVHHK